MVDYIAISNGTLTPVSNNSYYKEVMHLFDGLHINYISYGRESFLGDGNVHQKDEEQNLEYFIGDYVEIFYLLLL